MERSLFLYLLADSMRRWWRRVSSAPFGASWKPRMATGDWPPPSTTDLPHWTSTLVPRSVNISSPRLFLRFFFCVSLLSIFFFIFRVGSSSGSICSVSLGRRPPPHSFDKRETGSVGSFHSASLMLLWPLPRQRVLLRLFFFVLPWTRNTGTWKKKQTNRMMTL